MTWYRQKYICRHHIRARYNYVLKAKDLSGPVSNNSTGTHSCVSQCVCVLEQGLEWSSFQPRCKLAVIS